MKRCLILSLLLLLVSKQFYSQNWWHEINADSTQGTFIDARHGVTYKWVLIGGNIWMAENLRASTYANGDSIPYFNPHDKSDYDTGSYSWYLNDSINNGIIYGALYNWYAVSDYRNICPEGWHMPDYFSDFMDLQRTYTAFDLMKPIHWRKLPKGEYNSTGFSAIPAGRVDEARKYWNLSDGAFFWSSTEYNGKKAKYMALARNGSLGRFFIWTGEWDKRFGFSVRCIKD